MATDINLSQSSGGTRTYRGRTLEEILPQIRAELGPEAIILREREGLVGGVGGFFAQRFIEVDARRGEGQSIDIYDDAPEADLRIRPRAPAPEPAVAKPKALLPPEPIEIGKRAAPLPPEPALRPEPTPRPAPRLRSEPKPFVPPAVKREQPAPQTRRFEAAVFMDRLREASAILPEDPPEAPAADAESARRQPGPTAAAGRKPRAASTKPAKTKPARKPRPAPPAKPRTRKAPTTGWSAEIEAMPVRDLEIATARDLVAALPAEPEVGAAARRAADRRTAVRGHATVTEPEPPAASATGSAAPPRQRPVRRPPRPQQPSAPELPIPPAAPLPREPLRRRPRSISYERPVPPVTPLTAANGIGGAGANLPVPYHRPGTRAYRDEGLRGTIGRLVEGLRPTGPTRPAPAQPLDLVAATDVANELSTRGASQAWTSQLISAAGAHGNPLSGGSLRAAAEAEVARRIVPAPALPVTGAAIAFVGAGGSGKTRCTAALASAYRRGSTLEVTVLALDNPDGARELRRLLRGDEVPVLARSGERARRAVADARDGGLIIVDTVAATPTDRGAVHALGAKLEPLGLDALYVALPATLGPHAARRALASFGTLKPSAVAITHADETDQLAVVVEIAVAHRIPLAYFHSGTDHRSALSMVDPPAIAQQLLA